MATTSDSSCAHCGLPAPANAGAGPSFCCRGCESVWQLVHGAGLGDYYALRERLGGGEEGQPGRAQTPRAAELPAFAHLDDPELLSELRVEGREGSAAMRCTGMHCAACVWLIERLPQTLEGLERARVELGSGRVELQWDPSRVSLSRIAARLHEAGYELHRLDAEAERAQRSERRRELIRLAVTGASAGNVMLVSIALHAGARSGMEPAWTHFFEYAALLLSLPAVSYGAMPFFRGAWAGLRARTLHIDLPVALGVLAGFFASVLVTLGLAPGLGGGVYFDTVCILVFLLLVGRRVRARGQQWALSQTDLLRLLVPERAWRIPAHAGGQSGGQSGERLPCAASSLRVGERVEVRVGERIPADASLLRGRGSVDASSLTGEAQPISVVVGDLVLAGTTLVEGLLELEVRAVGVDTRVGSLAAQIMAADQERAPIARAVDRISARFVAAVLLLALVGGVVWWQVDPSRAFAVVVSLLVISCPCALGLATPMALAVARAQAARQGILVGSGAALEALASASQVVLDKTGTLTRGQPSVRSVALVDSLDASTLAPMLGALEAESEHPLAKALRGWAAAHSEVDQMRVGTTLEGVVELPGLGRRGRLRSRSRDEPVELRVGSPQWIAAGPLRAELDALLARGETPVLVELGGQPQAVFGLGDALHADALAAVTRLRALGLKLAIRSGDHLAAVAGVAECLGVADYAGAMTPEAKAHAMAERDAGHAGARVMVGDGVNDAAALRRAQVGIAVRGGAEVALRSADVHLAGEGLTPLVELFEGARRTMRVIRRNLAFSLAYNLCFASLALAGWIDPLAAALLMPASSLTVLLSSTLARSFGPTRAQARARARNSGDARQLAALEISSQPSPS